MSTEIPIEKEYYYITSERYKGKMPPFFTEEQIPEAKLIKQKFPEIKAEIDSFFESDKVEDLKPGFVPHSSWDGTGWKSIGLYAYGFKRNKNCRDFPVLTKIVESIPTMTSAQISVLKAGMPLRAHIDDTSAVARVQLAIRIPGKPPELAFRINGQNKGWTEGETMIICACRPHTAWNFTNEDRVIIIVDIIHDQYKNRKLRICGNIIAQLLMKGVVGYFPKTKNIPKWLTYTIQRTFGFGAYLILSIRHSLKI